MKKQLLKLFNEAGFHQPEMERLIVEHKFEKFAELIVQECINWIDGSPTTEEGTLILSKYFIIANLKQHFGVEE
jgi:hypothetical protein